MKHIFLFTVAALLLLPPGLPGADNQPMSGTIYLSKLPISQLLPIYEKLTGLDVAIDDAAKRDHYTVSYMAMEPKSKAEIILELEQSLREQAGIVIAKTDEKNGTAKFDPHLPITTINLPAHGQSPVVGRVPVIVLSSKDVDTNSVRIAASPDGRQQMLVFRLPGRTSDEIKAIKHGPVLIREGGTDMIEAPSHTYFIENTGNQVNYLGLILPFDKPEEARIALSALRGD